MLMLPVVIVRHKGRWPRGSSYHWTTEVWILCSTTHWQMD